MSGAGIGQEVRAWVWAISYTTTSTTLSEEGDEEDGDDEEEDDPKERSMRPSRKP